MGLLGGGRSGRGLLRAVAGMPISLVQGAGRLLIPAGAATGGAPSGPLGSGSSGGKVAGDDSLADQWVRFLMSQAERDLEMRQQQHQRLAAENGGSVGGSSPRIPTPPHEAARSVSGYQTGSVPWQGVAAPPSDKQPRYQAGGSEKPQQQVPYSGLEPLPPPLPLSSSASSFTAVELNRPSYVQPAPNLVPTAATAHTYLPSGPTPTDQMTQSWRSSTAASASALASRPPHEASRPHEAPMPFNPFGSELLHKPTASIIGGPHDSGRGSAPQHEPRIAARESQPLGSYTAPSTAVPPPFFDAEGTAASAIAGPYKSAAVPTSALLPPPVGGHSLHYQIAAAEPSAPSQAGGPQPLPLPIGATAAYGRPYGSSEAPFTHQR